MWCQLLPGLYQKNRPREHNFNKKKTNVFTEAQFSRDDSSVLRRQGILLKPCTHTVSHRTLWVVPSLVVDQRRVRCVAWSHAAMRYRYLIPNDEHLLRCGTAAQADSSAGEWRDTDGQYELQQGENSQNTWYSLGPDPILLTNIGFRVVDIGWSVIWRIAWIVTVVGVQDDPSTI